MLNEVRVMQRYKRSRKARSTMYLFLSMAGVVAMFVQSDLVVEQVGPFWTFMWGLGLAVASIGCLLGSFFGRWIGEYGFLPLLVCTLGLYGISAVAAAEPGTRILYAYGFLILAFASGLYARWQDIKEIKKESGTKRVNKGKE